MNAGLHMMAWIPYFSENSVLLIRLPNVMTILFKMKRATYKVMFLYDIILLDTRKIIIRFITPDGFDSISGVVGTDQRYPFKGVISLINLVNFVVS